MNHNFDVEIAVKYGVLEAILFENIAYWVDKNRANAMHFHDGLYWTYNSSKAFSEIFPYASSRTISRALHHLSDEGLIVTGNYNASSYDRTTWYAVTEKGNAVRQNGAFHLPNCQMEVSEMSNGSVENGEPIPDINTDINTDISSKDDIVGGTPTGPDQEGGKRENLKYNNISADFNGICKSLPEVKAMSDARKRAVRVLLNELESLGFMTGISPYDKLRELFRMVQESDFLSGRDGKWGKCSFDWIVNKKNALKILEGNYANKGGTGNGRNGTGNGGQSGGAGSRPLESTTLKALELFRRNGGDECL